MDDFGPTDFNVSETKENLSPNLKGEMPFETPQFQLSSDSKMILEHE